MRPSPSRLCKLLCILFFLSQLAWAIPVAVFATPSSGVPSTPSIANNTFTLLPTEPNRSGAGVPTQAPIGGGAITVLPLGDSITFGIGSSNLNSYRQFLQTRLADDGVEVDFIGSVKSGNMVDNDNEGHSGATIDQVSAFADAALPLRPQFVTLMAGTNDIILNRDVANAPSRLVQLVDKILATSPNSTILVSSLTPLPSFNRHGAVDRFNADLQGLVLAKANTGQRVVWVSMVAVTAADLADGVHPNDGGYIKMGQAWANGALSTLDKGLIK